MFTNSPDKHFIIDLHPRYPQVSFAAGFTGHGYKFASVIGEVMADLAERRESRHNISLFNLARFTGRVSDLYKEMPGMRVSGRIEPGMRTSIQAMRRRLPPAPGRRSGLSTTRHRVYSRSRMSRYAGGRQHPRPRTIHTVRDVYDPFDSTDPRYWEGEDVKPFWY
jgi:hypothetical protein